MNIRLQAAPVSTLNVNLGSHASGSAEEVYSEFNHAGGVHSIGTHSEGMAHKEEILHHFYLTVIETDRKLKELKEQVKRDPNSSSLQKLIAQLEKRKEDFKEVFQTFGTVSLGADIADIKMAGKYADIDIVV